VSVHKKRGRGSRKRLLEASFSKTQKKKQAVFAAQEKKLAHSAQREEEESGVGREKDEGEKRKKPSSPTCLRKEKDER